MKDVSIVTRSLFKRVVQVRRYWHLVLLGNLFFLGPGLSSGLGATNSIVFNYTNSAALVAAGWSFTATLPGGGSRNTEVLAPSAGVINYDQTVHTNTIRVPVDVGNMWGSDNSSQNTLFRSLATNWSSVRVLVGLSPKQNFEEVNLAVYQDDDNYVAIGHVYNSGEKIALYREFGRIPVNVSAATVNATNTWLRLDRNLTNDDITGYYSLDGTNWILIGQVSQALAPTRLCIWAGVAPAPWATGAPYADLQKLQVITSDTYIPPTPSLVLQPRALVFSATAGRPCTNQQQLHIVLSRDQDPSANWVLTNTASWLVASALTGSTPAACNVSVNPAGLAPGVYETILACGAPGRSPGPPRLR